MKLFKYQVLTLTSVPTLKLASVNRALFLAYQIKIDKFSALSFNYELCSFNRTSFGTPIYDLYLI